MSVSINPVLATNSITKPAVESKVFDTWFIDDFRLQADSERKFNACVVWKLGKLSTTNGITTAELSEITKTVELKDILGEDFVLENPEIASVIPSFVSACENICKRRQEI